VTTLKPVDELPEAARKNPYAALTREELDAALRAIDAQIAYLTQAGEAKPAKLEKKRRQILDGYLWLLVREGKVSWAGGKPKGSNNPVKLTPGPSISEIIYEMRD
jgi:hypothetical protein